jgi:hypothetical protein
MIKLKQILEQITTPDKRGGNYVQPIKVLQPKISNEWFDELYNKLKSAGIQMKLDKDKATATKELEKRLSASGAIPVFDDEGNVIPKDQRRMRTVSGSWVRDADKNKPGATAGDLVSSLSGNSSYEETSYANMMYYGMWVIWRNLDTPITFGKLDGSGYVVNFKFTTGTLVKEITSGISYNIVNLIKSTTNLINNKKAPLWSLTAWLRKDSNEIWNTQWAPLFKQAKQWWIDRLSSEDFETKIRKIRGWSKDTFRTHLASYLKIIVKTPIKAADGRWEKSTIGDANGVNWGQESHPDKEPGYFSSLPDNRIYIQTAHVYSDDGNSNIVIGNFGFYGEDVVNITVHELQHSLWSYLPFNPSVNWKKVFKSDIHMGTGEAKALYTNDGWWSKKNVLLSKDGKPNFQLIRKRKEDLVKKYGEYELKFMDLDLWLDPINSSGTFKKPTKDDWYGANANEHASRLEQFKQAKGLSILDKITIQHVIDTIKLGSYEGHRDKSTGRIKPESYLVPVVRGWVRNGMPDLQEFVDSLNTFLLVKQEKDKRIQQQRNRTYGDFTQSA